MFGSLRSQIRNISTNVPLRLIVKSSIEDAGHEQAAQKWQKVFFFLCVPLIALAAVNVLLDEEQERPEFKPYEHLRIRKKKFPWGDGEKTLFHNPHVNPLPSGYET